MLFSRQFFLIKNVEPLNIINTGFVVINLFNMEFNSLTIIFLIVNANLFFFV